MKSLLRHATYYKSIAFGCAVIALALLTPVQVPVAQAAVAPSFVAVSAFTIGNGFFSITPDLTGFPFATNDILFCEIGIRISNANTATITTGAGEGWASVFDQSVGANARTLLLWKRWGVGNTDDTTPTFQLGAGSAVWGVACSLFRDANPTGNPWDDVQSGTQSAATTGTAPAATSAGANRTVLRFFGTTDDNALGNNSEGTLAYGGANYDDSNGNGYSLALSYLAGVGSGSVGTATMQQTVNGADSWMLGTVILAPITTAPTVSTDFAGSVDTQGATLVGSITDNGGDDATQTGFAYSTDSALVSGVSTTTLGSFVGTGSFNQTLSALPGNTTYYFRAYATNGTGTGYGSILSFTTGDSTVSRRLQLFYGVTIKVLGTKLIIYPY